MNNGLLAATMQGEESPALVFARLDCIIRFENNGYDIHVTIRAGMKAIRFQIRMIVDGCIHRLCFG